jgi:hypothetical protein
LLRKNGDVSDEGLPRTRPLLEPLPSLRHILKKSAHLVLQMRTQVRDERLEETFRDWYPDFRTKPPDNEFKQAA